MSAPHPSPASNSLPVAALEWLWRCETTKRVVAVLLLAAMLVQVVVTGRKPW
jgi:hypothetical protein